MNHDPVAEQIAGEIVAQQALVYVMAQYPADGGTGQ